MTAAAACEAFSRLMPLMGKRSLWPVPGASKQTHRKSDERRRMTSRQTKDHIPVCTNNKTGPTPTSVTAILEPSKLRAIVSKGHTLFGSHSGRVRGTSEAAAVACDLVDSRSCWFVKYLAD